MRPGARICLLADPWCGAAVAELNIEVRSKRFGLRSKLLKVIVGDVVITDLRRDCLFKEELAGLAVLKDLHLHRVVRNGIALVRQPQRVLESFNDKGVCRSLASQCDKNPTRTLLEVVRNRALPNMISPQSKG